MTVTVADGWRDRALGATVAAKIYADNFAHETCPKWTRG